MHKIMSMYQFILGIEEILESLTWKVMPIFDHTHPNIFQPTFNYS